MPLLKLKNDLALGAGVEVGQNAGCTVTRSNVDEIKLLSPNPGLTMLSSEKGAIGMISASNWCFANSDRTRSIVASET